MIETKEKTDPQLPDFAEEVLSNLGLDNHPFLPEVLARLDLEDEIQWSVVRKALRNWSNGEVDDDRFITRVGHEKTRQELVEYHVNGLQLLANKRRQKEFSEAMSGAMEKLEDKVALYEDLGETDEGEWKIDYEAGAVVLRPSRERVLREIVSLLDEGKESSLDVISENGLLPDQIREPLEEVDAMSKEFVEDVITQVRKDGEKALDLIKKVWNNKKTAKQVAGSEEIPRPVRQYAAERLRC